jgi:hypothetical protein
VYAWSKRLSLTSAPAKLMNLPLTRMAPQVMLEMQTPSGYVLRLSRACRGFRGLCRTGRGLSLSSQGQSRRRYGSCPMTHVPATPELY